MLELPHTWQQKQHLPFVKMWDSSGEDNKWCSIKICLTKIHPLPCLVLFLIILSLSFPSTALKEFLYWILNSWVFENLKSLGVLVLGVHISFPAFYQNSDFVQESAPPTKPTFLKKKKKKKKLSYLFIFGCTTPHAGSWFADQGSNSCPLYWKHRVLTTGLPRKF